MTYYLIILLGILQENAVRSYESGSSETNKIEMTPFYETIIFGDVADILNEFDNTNAPLEAIITSGSESEENMEDLLTEYQLYLDKAHKQRMDYLENNRINTKNKIPLIRHDRFSKNKPGVGVKYNDVYYNAGYYNPTNPQQSYSSPLDFFLPATQKVNFIKPEFPVIPPKENREEIASFDKRINEFPLSILQQRTEPLKSMVKKPCKMCMMSHDSMAPNYMLQSKSSSDMDGKVLGLNSEYAAEDNTLNIRIKVDVQLPKTQDNFGRMSKNRSHDEDVASKEVSVPFPYFNFPIPMNLFGFKRYPASKYNRHDVGHHKKKKSRTNNNNKKHKKRVKMTWSNINTAQFIEPTTNKVPPNYDETLNFTDIIIKRINNSASPPESSMNSEKITPILNDTTNTMKAIPKIKTEVPNNDTQSAEKKFYVMVNISSTTDNGNVTEETHKDNSVETDYTTMTSYVANQKLITPDRVKRDISTPKPVDTIKVTTSAPKHEKPSTGAPTLAPVAVQQQHNTSTIKPAQLHEPAKTVDSKKSEKILLVDTELTYWPNSSQNQSTSEPHNITTIILERENQKAKLNMTKEAIRSNHTKALEKAIFGDANWDDVDTVAPVFMSFVGKYITGALTFCAQNSCHSMKCGEKTCIHRTCRPEQRWNQRGHCVGSKATDSVASLESIMDLPSNVAFEIVDILQDKMLGKMYGSIALCINSKCISFVTSKRNFLKSKCSAKELNNGGQCPTAKKTKPM